MPHIVKHSLSLFLLFTWVAACQSVAQTSNEQNAQIAVSETQSLERAAVRDRPNIIIILTDDQGFADVGFNGSTDILTPNIDRIAYEGVRFERGYVTYPVCGPSRAGLMTGRYQDRFGFGRNPNNDPTDARNGLPLSEITIAEHLKPIGYRTMAVGKWHLGTHESLLPRERGFDHFYGFYTGGHRYFPEELTLEDLSEVRRSYDWYQTRLVHDGTRIDIDEYLTDELSSAALDFVSDDSDAPFFLYLAYNAPHGPLQASEEYLSRNTHIQDERRRTYAAMISAVDDGVGKILSVLEDKGIADNTIIFFLSDNGASGREKAGSNNPLRGWKGDLFEGGIRVPFAARWPEKFPAGISYTAPVSSLDILGTIAAQTGLEVPADKPLDGVDLTPYVTAQTPEFPHDMLFWRQFDRDRWAATIQDYKLIDRSGDQALFDLGGDIRESKNLSKRGRKASLRNDIETLYDAWETQMSDPVFEPLGSWPRQTNGANNEE